MMIEKVEWNGGIELGVVNPFCPIPLIHKNILNDELN